MAAGTTHSWLLSCAAGAKLWSMESRGQLGEPQNLLYAAHVSWASLTVPELCSITLRRTLRTPQRPYCHIFRCFLYTKHQSLWISNVQFKFSSNQL